MQGGPPRRFPVYLNFYPSSMAGFHLKEMVGKNWSTVISYTIMNKISKLGPSDYVYLNKCAVMSYIKFDKVLYSTVHD